METDHMLPKSEGGPDSIDNAIPVCFECHAEIHAYNDKHPRGRKFTPEELRLHKEQWIAICKNSPQSLLPPGSVESDVGPIQALVEELEYNAVVAANNTAGPQGRGAAFENDQFRRAINVGSISLLPDDLRLKIHEAYAAMSRANKAVSMEFEENLHRHGAGYLRKPAEEAVTQVKPLIAAALEGIRVLVSAES
jgi:hypothetical protein